MKYCLESVIREGIYRILCGNRTNESIITQPVQDKAVSLIHTADTGFAVENENSSISVKSDDGETLICAELPRFEEYDVEKYVGGETCVRQTVDGLKISVVGGQKQKVRKSKHVRVTLKVSENDTFWGLGSHEEGMPCLNGRYIRMFQENMRIAVPMFISNHGYACLIDCNSYMTFDFTEQGRIEIYLDSSDSFDMYVLVGDRNYIYESYRMLTGVTPMLPKWACGYIQSKERYINAQELVDTVAEYRRREVPLDGIVQDWLYWNDGLWGDKVLDLSRYPDFSTTVDQIHDMNAKLMISIWPNMSGEGANRLEFAQKGQLLSDGSVYNAFSEEGREIYWKQAYEGLFVHGVDAWWCDSSEPFDANWNGEVRRSPEESAARAVEEFKKYIDDEQINAYSLYHSKGIYEHQRKVSDKRVMNLTRSGNAGQHRYGTVVWSGDVAASWQTLKKQVNILQNYISSGEAYWNSDVGAFFVHGGGLWFWNGQYNDGIKDEKYKELYVRWLQFAAFTPMLRSHGTDEPREIWRFGEKGEPYYDAIEKAIRLRYRLLPFFYSVNAAVTLKGTMPVTPLGLMYPGDNNACEAYGEYIYGEELLICPVTDPGQNSQKIYLPEGLWYDFNTHQRFDGGVFISYEVGLDTIPVFAKAGAIVPTAPVMQYADEIKNAEYEILCFGGADGSFELYDDAGDGYEYEKGAFSLIKIQYDDASKHVIAKQKADSKYEHCIRIVHID